MATGRHRRSRTLPAVALLLPLLALLALLRPASARAAPAIPPQFKQIAESANLQLYLDQQTTQVVVVDKRNGQVWSSNPVAGPTAQQAPGGSREQAVFFLDYTDDQLGDPKFLDSVTARPTVALGLTSNGAQIDYQFPQLGLGFTLIYQLGDDDLEAIVPNDSIVEQSTSYFARIELLPYFGAVPKEVPGYFFIPDGSGGLIHFRDKQPNYRLQYLGDFYGPADITFDPLLPPLRSDRAWQPGLTMPVFGEVTGDTGLLGIVTRGALDTTLIAEMRGKTGDWNRLATQFIYRRAAEFPVRRRLFASKIEPKRIPSEHSIRYVFLPGPGASYVDMAQVYRQYLMSERGVPRLGGSVAPLNLRLFMGVEKWSFPFSQFEQLTTFDQAVAMLDALKRRGVQGITVTLVGWEQGGYAGRWPSRAPPDGRLGGVDGLRRLVAASVADGDRLVLEDQYVRALDYSGGLLAYSDAIRGANRLPAISALDHVFLLNPFLAIQRSVTPDLPQMASWGVRGVLVQDVGEIAVADYNGQHPLSRRQYVDLWRGALDVIKRTAGSVGVVGPNDYTLGEAQYLANVPLGQIDAEFLEESVPFYQIAIHGLATYSGIEENLLPDPQRGTLRQLEYGALPSFELTQAPASLLKGTIYDDLYSSQFDLWVDAVVAAYQLAHDQLGDVWNQFIVGHQQLAPNVYATTYEDRTRVIVNYGDGDYRGGSTTVPANGYLIERQP
jgi:hypothetical protein